MQDKNQEKRRRRGCRGRRPQKKKKSVSDLTIIQEM